MGAQPPDWIWPAADCPLRRTQPTKAATPFDRPLTAIDPQRPFMAAPRTSADCVVSESTYARRLLIFKAGAGDVTLGDAFVAGRDPAEHHMHEGARVAVRDALLAPVRRTDQAPPRGRSARFAPRPRRERRHRYRLGWETK
jgi:hypothetical protein